jgi:hypothetical protein
MKRGLETKVVYPYSLLWIKFCKTRSNCYLFQLQMANEYCLFQGCGTEKLELPDKSQTPWVLKINRNGPFLSVYQDKKERLQINTTSVQFPNCSVWASSQISLAQYISVSKSVVTQYRLPREEEDEDEENDSFAGKNSSDTT